METVLCKVLIKNGGYESVQIPPEFIGELALAIQEKGSEVIHLHSRSVVAAGIFIFGKDAGDRVIVNT